MASINGDNIVPNEERNEKLVPFDFHENECDVIIKTKDKEVQLPSSFLEMVSSPMYFNNNVKYVFDVDVCAESVTKALSFYHPKDWTNKIDSMLSSTNFKEGQNRRIELPGKKFNEVVYFLQHLHSLQDIKVLK
uniref:Uncharacterized protein n=1 Tax=Clytia hemisphaerica TaxID=252671 RepID=A0A7M5UV49_9CNID